MSQATAFAAEHLRQLAVDAQPTLMAAKPYAQLNGRSLPDVLAVNELVKVWWEQVVVVPTWNDLPYELQTKMQERFLEDLAVREGFTPQLLDYAIMSAFFKGFAEEGTALPLARAEPIRGFPTQAGVAGTILSYERLSGADVAPFLRGRVFAALTKHGLIAKADVLTLMTLVDEMLAVGSPHMAASAVPHAINIEPASLLHADDYAQLEQQIRRLPATLTPRLCVEVTERGRESKRLGAIFRNLALLRQATGCQLAYDDYRGLDGEDEHLLILQPSSVKLDGALIKPWLVETEPGSAEFQDGLAQVQQLMNRVVEHAPHTSIVAEWAETPAAYQALAALGVDGVQSYVLEARAHADPSLLHLPPEVLSQRETALSNLASKRSTASELVTYKQDGLKAMQQAQQVQMQEMVA